MALRINLMALASGTLIFVAPLAHAQTAHQTPIALPPTQNLEQRIRAIMAEVPHGSRYGVMVVDENGRTVISLNPDARFIPASNTKMFTTAAAYTVIPNMSANDTNAGTEILLAREGNKNSLYLVGRGDARMSSAADCETDCLTDLAEAVAARTKSVDDIIGDATAFADDRWAQGMSWNNMMSWPGTAIGALMVDDNEVAIDITPPVNTVGPVTVEHNGYFTIGNRLASEATSDKGINYYRHPERNTALLWGNATKERTMRVGVDDPAHYAAWHFRKLLEERGVKVKGSVGTLYRHPDGLHSPRPPQATKIAALTPPPLSEDIVRINKESQNLHAEMLLRRIGATRNDPSTNGGLAVIDQMLASAGVARTAYDFSDGSGMSTYNRVSPRAMIQFLQWTSKQPWSAQWRNSLPIAGVDGTLESRFKGPLLAGKLRAKTGTLNQSSALSGFFPTAKGKTFTFAFFVNDIPQDKSPRPQMDRVIELIASEN